MTRPTSGSHDRLLTADDFPDCEACQMWRDAGASWPRPCFRHYTAEPVTGAAPAYPAVQIYGPIDSLRDRILVAIFDQAATMEHEFPAGPGHVVGVPDAATVAAKACYRWLLWRGVDLAKIEEPS